MHPSELRRSTAPSLGTPAAAFFVMAGCAVADSVVEVRDVYQGPARLGFVSVLRRMGGQVTSRRTAGHHRHPLGLWPLRGTAVPPTRSPLSTRCRPWPWPPPWPRARRSSPTSASCGQGGGPPGRGGRHGDGFGARAAVEGDTSPSRVSGPCAAPASTAGATTDGHGRRVAGLAAAPGERSVISGFHAVETSYPGFADDLRSVAAGESSPRALIVAIDGPAGAGKSTVSPAVAAAWVSTASIPGPCTGPCRPGASRASSPTSSPPWPPWRRGPIGSGTPERGVIDGLDVTDVIRSPEVGRAVSVVAAIPGASTSLVERQRAWAEATAGGGRGPDIGCVVFPRPAQGLPDGFARGTGPAAPDEPAAGVARRDRIDSTRAASPLGAAVDAPRLDTTTAAWTTWSMRSCRGCERNGPVPRDRGRGAERARRRVATRTSPSSPGAALYRIMRRLFAVLLRRLVPPPVVGQRYVPARARSSSPRCTDPSPTSVHRLLHHAQALLHGQGRACGEATSGWAGCSVGRRLPVHRESADREALQRAEDVLRRGERSSSSPRAPAARAPSSRT